ncbi:hypothetical protein ACHAWU_002792 [Discostella pseudostelligera]|uniref:Uncharacterized protein n=1 Tax=Discostella pseudostelligera TaxID=259834 RepID=A0ABD3M2G2_9STRA
MAPNSAIVAAGVSATFHLTRLVIDLVMVASETAKVNEAKIENAKQHDSSSKDVKPSSRGDRRLSTWVVNGRLSVRESIGRSYRAPDERRRGSSFLSRFSTATTTTSPPVGESTTTTATTPAANGTTDAESQTADAEEPKVGLEAAIPKISLFIHLVLVEWFIAATVLTSTSSQEYRPAFANALYDSIPLGCVSVAVFIGLLMNIRDYSRKRLTSVQRGLYSICALILMMGCIVSIAFPPTVGESGTPTSVDITSLVCLIVYALLAITEGRICRYPKVNTKDGKKLRLNRRALLTILKPYFWPQATATSATLNRIRAISTWVFVASSKACSLTAPIFLGKASTALTRGDYPNAIKYSCIYAVIQFSSTTLKEFQSLVYLHVAQAAFVELSEASFNHLHSLSLDWHLMKKLGEVIRSMDRGIAACDTLMKYLFLWLVPSIAECLMVTIIFATYFDYFPLAVSVFFFVYTYIFWTIIITLWRKKFRKQVAKSDNDWHDRCTDSLINFETVKYFTAEEYEKKRFGESVKTFQSGSINVQASLSFLNITQQVLLQACLATSLSLAVISIQQRYDCCIASGCEDGNSACCSALASCTGLEVGDFITVLSYTLNLFMPLNFLGSVYNLVVMAIVDLTNLSELLAEKPDVTDAPDAMDLPLQNMDDRDVAVEFDNVNFHYPTQPDTKGLKGLSFKMKRGTVTAIVGPTGEGKTTVSRLLFRFYDVLGGAVKVNGVDVRSLKQKSLRGNIGVVPQNTSLFNDTLKNNIKYGRQDATDEEVLQVIKDAQLQTFVDSLPEGWDTMVGDRGLKLSGGEKQRSAIARCLLKNPSIVVLDEATSSLDTITENSVQEALDRLGSARTVLVIAHRLGTIKKADNIIVLGGGKVAEEGTHDELLAKGGKYAELWNMQLHSTSDSKASSSSLNGLNGHNLERD